MKNSKNKLFNVAYKVTISYEATFKAANKEEARRKVIEVVGEPLEIESIDEVQPCA